MAKAKAVKKKIENSALMNFISVSRPVLENKNLFFIRLYHQGILKIKEIILTKVGQSVIDFDSFIC
ncbi:hypothetical protein N1I81_19495 [Bacillus sp. FSL M8-0052]|uniref:hypothetical protein n=1 Tax=Bacillus TaxID=1386 RepID=UPI0030F63A01